MIDHVFAVEVDEGEGRSPSLVYYVVTPHELSTSPEALGHLVKYFPVQKHADVDGDIWWRVRCLDREPLILGKVKGATYWRRHAEIAAEGREMWRARAGELEAALTALYGELHDEGEGEDEWSEDTSLDVFEDKPQEERKLRVAIPLKLRALIERLLGS